MVDLIESEIDELGEDGWNLVADLSRAPLGTRARPFYSMIQDRADGKFGPYFSNEWDLRRMRAVCRLVESQSSIAEAAFETLAGYVVGTGFAFKAKARPNAPEGSQNLAAAVQRFLDQFVDVNGIKGGKDDEVHRFSRIDGERPTAVAPSSDGLPRLRVFDPNQITQPASTKPIERAYDFDARDKWEFGVHTRVDEYGRHDASQVLGYHVLHDEAGYDWEYIPRDRMELFRRNVPSEAKRGVSDLFKPVADLQREGKLSRNAAEGMAILSAIAYIKENANVSAGQPGAPGGSDSITAVRGRQDGGSRSVVRQRFHPGTIVQLFNGAKYSPSPLSSMNTGALRDVSNTILMRVGSRWAMPGYMMTGDTNTGLYSSVLVMGSPFVNARVRDQEWFKARWLRLVWKALKCASATDWFGAPLEHVERFVEIEAVLPPISLESGEARANRQNTEIQAGVLSRETAIEESGRDPKIELPRIEEEQAKQPPADPLAGMLGESLKENCGTGSGGFKIGNKCQKDRGGGGKSKRKGTFSREEKNAIEDYTTDKFQAVNGALRGEGELKGETKKLVDAVDSALEKAPKHEGTVFRSFQADPSLIAQLQPGKTFSDKAFMSTSKEPPKFIPKGSVALQIVGKNGVDIESLSLHGKAEKEVLFPRGSKFEVVKAQQHPQGGWVAILKELPGGLVESLFEADFWISDDGGRLEARSRILERHDPAFVRAVAESVTDRIFEGYP